MTVFILKCWIDSRHDVLIDFKNYQNLFSTLFSLRYPKILLNSKTYFLWCGELN